jgi:hypothetical protein
MFRTIIALDPAFARRPGAGDPVAHAGGAWLQEGESPAVREIDGACRKRRNEVAVL